MQAARAPDAPAKGERGTPDPVDAPRVLSIDAADYPAALRDLADPPAAVYVRGLLPAGSRAIAVVGSRAASPYGIAMARSLAADLARLGFTVVSGLARGIDAAAHAGALEAGGRTVAVLPGGLDAVTPRHHVALAETIAVRGGLLTEWASGEPRSPGMFVRRNRLIAALASAVVVVEAAERSGALSTAAAARRLGRALLAVPGDVDRPTSRGCHALIRQGAALCEDAGDVLCAARPPAGEAGPEARLLAALADEPRALETLAGLAELPLDQALAALLHLEWAGAAKARPGQRWVRAASRGT